MPKLKLPKVAINTQTVIKTAVIVAVAVGLVALGAGVGKTWTDTKNKQEAAEAKRTAQLVNLQTENKELEQQVATYKEAYQSQRLNCERGKIAYDLLPVITKNKIKPGDVPTCTPTLL